MPLTWVSPTKAVDLSRPEYSHLKPYAGPITLGRVKQSAALARRVPAPAPAKNAASPSKAPAPAATSARRATSHPLPKSWTEALQQGHTNDALHGFITAGVLPDPRELKRTGRLAWEGSGVWNELERRGLLGW